MCYVTKAGLQSRYGTWDTGTARHGAVFAYKLCPGENIHKKPVSLSEQCGETRDSGAVNTTARDIWIAICAPPPPPPLHCHLVISIITLIGETTGLGWDGLGWAGLGWAGEECDVINIAHCTPLLTNSHLTHIPDIQWKDRFKRSLFLRILKLFNMTDGRKFEFNHCWH